MKLGVIVAFWNIVGISAKEEELIDIMLYIGLKGAAS